MSNTKSQNEKNVQENCGNESQNNEKKEQFEGGSYHSNDGSGFVGISSAKRGAEIGYESVEGNIKDKKNKCVDWMKDPVGVRPWSVDNSVIYGALQLA